MRALGRGKKTLPQESPRKRKKKVELQFPEEKKKKRGGLLFGEETDGSTHKGRTACTGRVKIL